MAGEANNITFSRMHAYGIYDFAFKFVLPVLGLALLKYLRAYICIFIINCRKLHMGKYLNIGFPCIKLAQQQYLSKLWYILSLNTNRMCRSNADRRYPYRLEKAIVPEFHAYCYHESSG